MFNNIKLNRQEQHSQKSKNFIRTPKYTKGKQSNPTHQRFDTQTSQNLTNFDQNILNKFLHQTPFPNNKILQDCKKSSCNTSSFFNSRLHNLNGAQINRQKHQTSLKKIQKQLRYITEPSKEFFKNIRKVMCMNHTNRQVQFQLILNNHQQTTKMGYCSVCAAQLASQGFSVQKIQKQETLKTNFEQKIEFSSRKLNNKVRIEKQIKNFLKEINITRQQHVEVLTKCLRIQEVYREQIHLLSQFYDTAIDVIKRYRDQHINGLQYQSQNVVQDHQRQVSHLKKSINQIDAMITQIKCSFPQMIQTMSDQEFKSYFNCYGRTKQVLQARVHQINSNISQLPSYQIQHLQPILRQLDKIIQLVISSKNAHSRSIYTCIKPIKLNLKSNSNRNNSLQTDSLRKIPYTQNKNPSMTMDRSNSTKNIKKSYEIQQENQQSNIGDSIKYKKT